MLKGDVFKNQKFENQIFALFINLFMNGKDGVAQTYKNAMNITYSGHNVTVNSGACLVQGRLCEEDSSTTIDAGIETMFCKLVVEIDLDKVNTSSTLNQLYYNIVKSSSAYPELTQEDIVGQNAGKYQYELARFKISDGAITDFEDKRTYIENLLQYQLINTLNSSKAPVNHASSGTNYGIGTANNYGHCKLANNLTTGSYSDGVALPAYQGKILNDKINNNYNYLNGRIGDVASTLAQDYQTADENVINTIVGLLAGYLKLSGGTMTGTLKGRNIEPSNNNSYNLGSTSMKWKNIYAKAMDIDGEIDCGDIGCENINGKNISADWINSQTTYDNTVSSSANVNVNSNGTFHRSTSSSKRYKKDITEDIEEKLNPQALYDLPIKQFKYRDSHLSKEDRRSGENIIGFIVEDLAEIYESAVDYNEKGQPEMWNYKIMIPAMLKLIQEHNKRIKVLEEKAGVVNE